MGIKMTLELPIKSTKKDKWYVASCPALDVVSQGDSQEEAKVHLSEALVGFLESCFEHGALDAVLRECGFSPIPSTKSGMAGMSRDDYFKYLDECK